MNSPLLQACLSHFIAKRDKCLAELHIALNNSSSIGNPDLNTTDRMIKLFEELSLSDSTIITIKVIMDNNTDIENKFLQETNKIKEKYQELISKKD